MKKILLMLLVLLGLGMTACSLDGFLDNPNPEHSHSVVDGWKNDATNHWKICDSCDEKLELEAHKFGEWEKVEGLDLEVRSCACGWEEQRSTTPEEKNLTVYYYNSLSWETVNAYVWNADGNTLNGEWPGTAMVASAEDAGWYTVTLTATTLEGLNIIFNDGSTQTGDIVLSDSNVYYYGLNTEGFASKEAALEAYEAEQSVPNLYYLRGDMNSWGTTNPLTVNGNVASIEIDIERNQKFKVATENYETEFGLVNGEYSSVKPTGDIVITASGKYRISIVDYGTSNETLTVELLEAYEEEYVKNEYYFRGTINGADNWNTCDDTVKFVAGETSATYEVTLGVGDKFKVSVAGDGWTPQYNASNTTLDSTNLEGTDDIIVKTAGKYKLEVTGWGTAEEKLVITLVEATETPEVPEDTVLEVQVGDSKYTLTPNPDPTKVGEYQVLDVTMVAGQVLKVLVNGEEATAEADSWTGNNLNAEMKIVNDATAAIYVKPAANGWSVWVNGYVAPETPDPEQPGETEEVIVSYYNTLGWASVYAYVWDANETKILGAWPGTQMTADTDANWYTVVVSAASLEGLNIIFNNNSGNQTADILLDSLNPYYYGNNTTGHASKEAAIAAYEAEQEAPVTPNVYYLRGDMNGWNTTNPLVVNGDVASIEIELTANQKFKVATLNYETEFGLVNGEYSNVKPTTDIVVAVSGKYRISVINYGTDNEKLTVELLEEAEDQTPVETFYYIVGGFNGWAAKDEDYIMAVDTEVEGQYVITNVSLTANQTLKVIAVTGDSTIWHGQDNLKGEPNFTVTDDKDDNIVVGEAGTYSIYFKVENNEIYMVKTDTTGGEGGETPEDPVEKMVTIYFQNNWDWNDIRVYLWNDSTNNAWPGVRMDLVGVLYEKELYSYTFDANTYSSLIISGINPSWESGRDQSPNVVLGTDLSYLATNAYCMGWDGTNECNTISYFGFETTNVTAHTCSFSETWSYDEDNHWHECRCGKTSDSAEHTLVDNACGICDYAVASNDSEPIIITVYFTLPDWGDGLSAPSLHYWGTGISGTDWNTIDETPNMTPVDSNSTGSGATYKIDVEITGGSLSGLIVFFDQNGTNKQSNDITENLPTTTGEYVITAGFNSWDWNKFLDASIAAK